MKPSTRKIIGVDVCVLILIGLTNLLSLSGVVRSYLQVAILAGVMGTNIVLLGWAKPRSYNTRLIAIFTVLAAVVFQLATFLLLGLKLGFIRNVYLWNWTGLLKVFLPVALAIVGEEILRGQLIERGKRSVPAVVLTGVTVCVLQVLIALPIYDLGSARDLFSFIVIIMGLAILTNILLAYIAYAYDYRINIAYRLVMEMPVYILPILPNAGEYLPAIFQIGLVFVLALWLIGMYQVAKRETKHKIVTASELRIKRSIKWAGLGIIVIIVLGYVALMSGLFKYHFLAVGSGSMEPNLSRGDMVLVEKMQDYDQLVVGDVLIYRHSNIVVVHRIAEVHEMGGKYSFITKGDANDAADKWTVAESDVIGTARGKIVMFGYPTLWLNELFNKD